MAFFGVANSLITHTIARYDLPIKESSIIMPVFLLEKLKETLHHSLETTEQELRTYAVSQLQRFYTMVNETSTLNIDQKKESIDFIEPYKDLLSFGYGCPILEACSIACAHIKVNDPNNLSSILLFSLNHALVHIKQCVQEHRKPSRLDNANFMLFVKMTFDYIQSREKHVRLIALHESIRSINTLGMKTQQQETMINSIENNIVTFPVIFKRSKELIHQTDPYLEIGVEYDHIPKWKEPCEGDRAEQDILILLVNSEPKHVKEIEATGIHETFIASFEMKERASRTLLHHTSHKAMITFDEEHTKRCDMLDISISGMQIRTEYKEHLNLAVGKKIDVQWEEGFHHYPTSAHIRWFQKTIQGEVKIGVQFIIDNES